MEQLKTGLWYRSTQSRTNSIYFLKNISNNSMNPHYSYGIDGINKWSNFMNRCLEGFQPAEKEVVINALKREALKRYMGKQVICLSDGYPHKFNENGIDFHFEDNDMYSGGALIYRKGKWADIIDRETEIIKEAYYEIY